MFWFPSNYQPISIAFELGNLTGMKESSCPQITKDIFLVFKEKTVALAVKEVTVS